MEVHKDAPVLVHVHDSPNTSEQLRDDITILFGYILGIFPQVKGNFRAVDRSRPVEKGTLAIEQPKPVKKRERGTKEAKPDTDTPATKWPNPVERGTKRSKQDTEMRDIGTTKQLKPVQKCHSGTKVSKADTQAQDIPATKWSKPVEKGERGTKRSNPETDTKNTEPVERGSKPDAEAQDIWAPGPVRGCKTGAKRSTPHTEMRASKWPKLFENSKVTTRPLTQVVKT